MNILFFVLVSFIFGALVLMVWLWQHLSATAIKLEADVESLRQWQREHLPLEHWNMQLEHSFHALSVGVILVDPLLQVSLV